MKLDSRTYMNVILTVIAVLLLVMVVQPTAQLDPTSAAYAAREKSTKNEQQQARWGQLGVGESEATKQVAAANDRIAREVGEVAKAIRTVAKSVDKMAAAKARGN